MNNLQLKTPAYYKVKQGQTLREIADAFCVAERVLVKENNLKAELCAGQILKIPKLTGNRYTVQAGDSKKQLSGSRENYEKKNGTSVMYLGMRVVL